MTENKAKRIVAEKTKDWMSYMNPNIRPSTFLIDPACLDQLNTHGFDGMAMVAQHAATHYPRLSQIVAMGCGVALSEAFITTPVEATWQIILMGGVIYVSATEVLPYE